MSEIPFQDEGIPPFLDEHDTRLGDRWIRTLSEGVEYCKVMLSVVAPASYDRQWLLRRKTTKLA